SSTVLVDLDRERLAHPCPYARERFVPRDRGEPGRRVSGRRAVQERQLSREGRLLHGILGLDLIAQQGATERAHECPVTLVELLDQRRDRGTAADIRTGLVGGTAHLIGARKSVTQVTAGGGEH